MKLFAYVANYYDLFICWNIFRLICKLKQGLIELVKRGMFLFFGLKRLVLFPLNCGLSWVGISLIYLYICYVKAT